MIKAVIFDYDGTLVDFVGTDIFCLRVVHSACGAICSSEEFIDIAVEEIMSFHSLVEKGIENPLDMHRFRLENTFSRCGTQWDTKFLNLYKTTLFGHINLFDGVKELLSKLKKQGIKLGLVTNAYDGVEQRERISLSGIKKYFDAIVISGEVGYSKPSSEIFNCLLSQLGLNPDQAIYVGDSERYDIQGAKNTGMRSILLS
jgi:HAD superfamily hydrolase (TIGR01662 family)